ncbi:MAG TPA: bifunctional ADP-dependent NAD(P)H-hydrate dehydratase/NAD(P)H-hydrate epimerase, partial [Sulfurospirillum sp. UBA11407]
SLIAQGYTNLEASIHASLAHVLSVKKMKLASYALNPLDICEGIKWLQKK